jgi:hypothetical protein
MTGRREGGKGERGKDEIAFFVRRDRTKNVPLEGREADRLVSRLQFAHPKSLPAFPPSCCFLLDRQDAMNGYRLAVDFAIPG